VGEPEIKRMTIEEFLEWQAKQDENYELVDGMVVVPAKMMTGASSRHDRAVVNIILSLGNRLRGRSCRPTTDDIAVRIPAAGLRRPDITIECGAPGPKDTTAADPRVVIEVLSPSTMGFDRIRKVEEYKTVDAIQVILNVDTEQPRVAIHRRVAGVWTFETVEGIDKVLALQEIAAELPLADVFEGVI
jgi:Uma2 family endonuclease